MEFLYLHIFLRSQFCSVWKMITAGLSDIPFLIIKSITATCTIYHNMILNHTISFLIVSLLLHFCSDSMFVHSSFDVVF